MRYTIMSERFILDILSFVNTRNERGQDFRIVAMMPPLQGETEYTAILEEREVTDNTVRPNFDPLLNFFRKKHDCRNI